MTRATISGRASPSAQPAPAAAAATARKTSRTPRIRPGTSSRPPASRVRPRDNRITAIAAEAPTRAARTIGGGWTIASSASALAPTTVAATTATATEDEGDDGGQPRGHDRRIDALGVSSRPDDLASPRERRSRRPADDRADRRLRRDGPLSDAVGVRAPRGVVVPGLARVTPSRLPGRGRDRVPPARWSDCGSGFLCADIRVPRDYDDPSQGYLTIALVRLPATRPQGPDRFAARQPRRARGVRGRLRPRAPASRASSRRHSASASTSSASTRAA